jgi:hypothetical protein
VLEHLIFICSDEFSIVFVMHCVEVLIDPVDIEVELIFDLVERLEVIVHCEQTRYESLLCLFNSRRNHLLMLLFITFVIWQKDNLLFIF